MAMLSNPAFGPRVALIYMTIGSLIDVWTGVIWYYFIYSNPEPVSHTTHFLVTAFLLTGATLMALGLFLGPLGQYARKAELPPKEAEKKEEAIQQTAAATPHPVAPGMAPGMMPGMVPGAGQVVPPGYVAPGAPPVPAAPAPQV